MIARNCAPQITRNVKGPGLLETRPIAVCRPWRNYDLDGHALNEAAQTFSRSIRLLPSRRSMRCRRCGEGCAACRGADLGRLTRAETGGTCDTREPGKDLPRGWAYWLRSGRNRGIFCATTSCVFRIAWISSIRETPQPCRQRRRSRGQKPPAKLEAWNSWSGSKPRSPSGNHSTPRPI